MRYITQLSHLFLVIQGLKSELMSEIYFTVIPLVSSHYVHYGLKNDILTHTLTFYSLLFLYKLFLFTRELAYTRINISSNTEVVILLKIKRRDFFSTRQHSYFGVTHCENWKVQIAVFSK